MELRHLRYFKAVAQEKNLRRAAERVHVTQPALSQAIKALEDEIGFPLFQRSSTGMRLTSAGEVLAVRVRAILQELDLAVDSARLAERGDEGSLSLAVNEVGGHHRIVGDTLRLFRAAHPKVAIELRDMFTGKQRAALSAGEIDGGFQHAAKADESESTTLLLERQDFVLAAASDHPLLAVRRLHLADLEGVRMVWLQRSVNASLHDGLMAAFVAKGMRPNISIETRTDVSTLNLVAAGVGVAIVVSARRWAGSKRVVMRRINDLSLPVQFIFAWRKDNPSTTLQNFIAILRQQAKQESAAGPTR